MGSSVTFLQRKGILRPNMFGNAAVTGISSLFSMPVPFLHGPGFSSFLLLVLPPHQAALGQSVFSASGKGWGRDGTPNPSILGGFMALEFRKPRRAGRTHMCEKVSCREQGSPIQKQRQGSRVGAARGVAQAIPGLGPKRLELQVKDASGILPRPPQAGP